MGHNRGTPTCPNMTPAVFRDETVDASTSVVTVTGELDQTNIERLRRSIDMALADGHTHIVVDMTGVTHMDSSGLAELINSHQRTLALEGGLALIVRSRAIRRTLEIRGVRDIFTLVETREQALASLAG